MANEFNVLDFKKTRMKYFINDFSDIREKGTAMFGLETSQRQIEDAKDVFEIEEDHLIFLQFKIDFDLIYLDKNNSFLRDKEPKDIQDDEVSARLKFRFEGILTVNKEKYAQDESFSELFNKEIIRFTEPYIRKEIREFTNELEIPMFPLSFDFLNQISD